MISFIHLYTVIERKDEREDAKSVILVTLVILENVAKETHQYLTTLL